MEKSAFGKYCITLLNENLSYLNNKLRTSLDNLIEKSKIPPHITLRETFFSNNINKCIDNLRKQYPLFKNGVNISIKGYTIFDNRYLVLSVKNNCELQILHDITMNISQEFVDNFKKYNSIGRLTKRQRELLEKFNNPFSFEYYTPHSTIGKINDNVCLDLIT